MTIAFREGSLEDVSSILEMMASFYAIDRYPFDREITHDNLEHFLSAPSLGRLWMIQHDHTSIGYIVLAFGFSFEYGGRDAFIDELFLKSEFRNKGIGVTAMSFVEQQARLLQVKTLHLEVEKHNVKGNRLYSNQGFANNGRMLLSKTLYKNP
jgi:GNAT superfamily N-acetyltransferase